MPITVKATDQLIKTVVDAVKVKTDNLPSDPADASVVAGNITTAHSTTDSKIDVIDGIVDDITIDTSKIDDVAVSGLLGTAGSLAYKIHEIEKHFHNNEFWFGLAASPNGEIHRADRMGGAIAPFSFVSGNSDYGNWVQVLGSDDTPVITGKARFEPHRFLITTTNSTAPFIFQFTYGESADLAAKVAANDFTETPYIASTNNNDSGISDVMSSRLPTGGKAWARVCCIGQNAKTINAYFGIHEYEG